MKRVEYFILPAIGLILYLVTRRKKTDRLRTPIKALLLTGVLPVLGALVFGLVMKKYYSVPVYSEWDKLWYFLLCPIGEELLFRGFFYNIMEQKLGDRLLTLTNPLPLAVWGSSIAFSLWHLQNLGYQSTAWTLFQVAYCLPLGIWLGYLRWKSQSLALPTLFHVLINTFSHLGSALACG